jgi:endonuclease/exonuclease/phosphatase family metal-dependent hydrolase
MKNLILFLTLSMCSPFMEAQPFKALTYNVRYDNPQDGDDRWEVRKAGLLNVVRKAAPDLVGFQEVLAGQLADIRKSLPGFSYVGVGRDDGGQEGEFTPLFFNEKRFTLLEQGYFWLSENPDEPGKGWDAACNRMCCWLLLKEKVTKKHLLVMNTHLDHQGIEARVNSIAQLTAFILEKSDDYIEKRNEEMSPNISIVLMGDFNITPDDAGYKDLVDSRLKLFEGLTDAFKATSTPPVGSEGTFNGFNTEETPAKRIDYIWTIGLEVRNYTCLDERLANGRWPSDHCGVIAEIDFAE